MDRIDDGSRRPQIVTDQAFAACMLAGTVKVFAGIGGALKLLRKADARYGARAALSAVAGVDQDTIGRWERGEIAPKMESLDAVLAALGATAHDLADALDKVNGRSSNSPGIGVPLVVPTAEFLQSAFPGAPLDILAAYSNAISRVEAAQRLADLARIRLKDYAAKGE